jgi:hypothetical protein
MEEAELSRLRRDPEHAATTIPPCTQGGPGGVLTRRKFIEAGSLLAGTAILGMPRQAAAAGQSPADESRKTSRRAGGLGAVRLPRRALCELTSRQCNAYQVQGGDIMLVPVGSVEVLGPAMPVGGRCFVAEAFCRLMAEQVDGLCLPVTPYVSVQNTFDQPGSVSVPERTVNAYVRAVLDDLLATGFRRIFLVTQLDCLRYYTPQEFYEDHNVAAAGIHLGELLGRYYRELGVGEDSCIVGALRLLGRNELAEKVERENQRLLDEGSRQAALPESLVALRRVGTIGFCYPRGAYPLPPNPKLSGEKGEQALRRAAADLAPAVESLRDYNEFLAKRHASRGLLWRGWRWTNERE